MTLLVADLGTDSGTCTVTGTAACKRIQGAINLVQKGIRHAVIINVANYTGTGAFIEGYTCEPGVSTATGAYMQVVGALANVTPATGSATGTATSGTAQSGNAFGFLTNTAEGWTVNDFQRK